MIFTLGADTSDKQCSLYEDGKTRFCRIKSPSLCLLTRTGKDSPLWKELQFINALTYKTSFLRTRSCLLAGVCEDLIQSRGLQPSSLTVEHTNTLSRFPRSNRCVNGKLCSHDCTASRSHSARQRRLHSNDTLLDYLPRRKY